MATSYESIYKLNIANIYLFKVNNRNTKRYEICPINRDTKMTVCYYHVTYALIASAKIPERKRSISPFSFYGKLLDY